MKKIITRKSIFQYFSINLSYILLRYISTITLLVISSKTSHDGQMKTNIL